MKFIDKLRSFELRVQENLDNITVPIHLCLGQEKAPDDIHTYAKPHDWVFSTHRNHGHYLAKGGSERKLWDEIMGLPSGVNGGFCGSMCFSDESINFHSSAIVGGLIGTATGVALANKLSGNKSIVFCCIGDGATEQGVFWESLNFSVVHNLKIIYVCENNAMSGQTPIFDRQSNSISHRVKSFGITVCARMDEAISVFTPAFIEYHVTRTCPHASFHLQ